MFAQGEARQILEIDREMYELEEEEPLYGFLMRKTRLSWIQRWCVCSDNSLYISKSPKDHLSVTKIYLPHYSICRCPFEEGKRNHVFKIWSEGKKNIYLAAQNDESRDQWVKGLRLAARSDKKTPVNTLTKSTISKMASHSLSTLKGITLKTRSREGSSSEAGPALLKSPSDPTLERSFRSLETQLAATLEAEFGSTSKTLDGSSSKTLEPGRERLSSDKASVDTVVLSGTLKKLIEKQQWEYRYFVVMGPILREYIAPNDEWPQESNYLPGCSIRTITKDPRLPYILTIGLLGNKKIYLAAATMLEMKTWEYELTIIAEQKPDSFLQRELEPEYVDIERSPEVFRHNPPGKVLQSTSNTFTPNMFSPKREPVRSRNQTFGSTENKSSSLTGEPKREKMTPTPRPKRTKHRPTHRRTHSDNTRYSDPKNFTMLPENITKRPRPPYADVHLPHGGRSIPLKPEKPAKTKYSDIVIPPPPTRPPPQPPLPGKTQHSQIPAFPDMPTPPPPSRPVPALPTTETGGWPYKVPVPDSLYNRPSQMGQSATMRPFSQEARHPPQGPHTLRPFSQDSAGDNRSYSMESKASTVEVFSPVTPNRPHTPTGPNPPNTPNKRPLTPGSNARPTTPRNKNRQTFIYSDSPEDFALKNTENFALKDRAEPYNRCTQRLEGTATSSIPLRNPLTDPFFTKSRSQSFEIDQHGILGIRERNESLTLGTIPSKDDPPSPFDRRANTPTGTRFDYDYEAMMGEVREWHFCILIE